ncbi:MAG: hypothetical protein WBM43_10470 [Flavobacteriaceae bacterium]
MNHLRIVLSTVKKESPILFGIGIFHFFLALLCLIGLMVDERTLMGVSVWLKPLKFTISGGIYILTVGFLTTLYPFSRRKKNILNNILSWALLFEILIIFMQAARGILSHYNQSNIVDGLLFAAMGILIGIVVLLMVFFIIETIRLRLDMPRSIQWGILLGWLVLFYGSWVGGQMIGQMAHNVGVADGGEGLPLLNWSTVAGDLRVAHFFGLHAIQIIPLFAWGLYRKWKAPNRRQTLVVILFGIIYASWIAFTFYQARQGLPFIGL